jgi:hypothetical protein
MCIEGRPQEDQAGVGIKAKQSKIEWESDRVDHCTRPKTEEDSEAN